MVWQPPAQDNSHFYQSQHEHKGHGCNTEQPGQKLSERAMQNMSLPVKHSSQRSLCTYLSRSWLILSRLSRNSSSLQQSEPKVGVVSTLLSYGPSHRSHYCYHTAHTLSLSASQQPCRHHCFVVLFESVNATPCDQVLFVLLQP